ncbi:hypothetical protein [Leptospira bandrabouensis]|uniref:Uncharacterized protein n=1 Tax=Leptospira bandrabouensis TaxID=2484903 RepID=A0A6H3NR18_9LEPT|nr:hypothetical protein [Leptospira bandrabouensis]TGN11597.1 hypothetical protein EHR08_17035 [Leptospira bandrabouensis]
MIENESINYELTPDIHERMTENRIEFLIQNKGIFDITEYRKFLNKKYLALPRDNDGKLKNINYDYVIAIIHDARQKYIWDVTDVELLKVLQDIRTGLLNKGLDLTEVEKAIEETRQIILSELSEKLSSN